MQYFDSLEEAFQWFLDNTYPKLTPEQKNEIKDVRYDFTSGRSKVSHKRILKFMAKYGQVNTHYSFEEEI